ncbi:MAG: tRNA glutamyl-Q(34) synthetase GluQRS [Candidatus Competibacteraceae bacterium]|nr:MAG: tRNA glutamyl-Q(34) synthetase GluQRS [Candidatus Competibacteraceae bacterium]
MARGRFAPSPTGPLHAGSLVAALGSYLAARQQGGQWWVRIEDVDTPRTVPGAADAILRALERCALFWDGPVLYQSRRTERYQAALESLVAAGLAYPCTCTRRELAHQPRARDGGPIYPGTCRGGVSRPDRPRAMRFRVAATSVEFQDALQGLYRQHLASEVGDFVLRRADGLFAYQLAVVVDDADQGITQVVRGSDLLDSTPRQIDLQRRLGLPTPAYAHLPVALDACGEKLSKQTHAPPLDERQPSPALVAALRFLGQQPPPELERETPALIVSWALAHWRLERVPTVLARGWEHPPVHEPISLASMQSSNAVDNTQTMN